MGAEFKQEIFVQCGSRHRLLKDGEKILRTDEVSMGGKAAWRPVHTAGLTYSTRFFWPMRRPIPEAPVLLAPLRGSMEQKVGKV